MSKILCVCYRKATVSSEIEKKIKTICDDLDPDNINSNPVKTFSKDNIVYGITNPTSTIETKDSNVLLGKLFEKNKNWAQIGEYGIDGNFAIFRNNEKEIEIVTDCLGTRSVWYYFDEEAFIVATSQKSIIKFLGNFQFDEQIIPWIISTGSLGPSHCWDKRIKRVPSDGVVTVDKSKWVLKAKSQPVKFLPSRLPKKQQEKLLKKAIDETFNNINLDFKKWAITLSGGHDSRAILSLFQKIKRSPGKFFQTITWGTQGSISDTNSDAYIAELIAEKIGTNHKYYHTELSDEPVQIIINRFLNNGEGRIDHISGYLDGFRIWKRIYEDGYEGIIRGDEVFGYNKIISPLIVNSFMGLTLCSEYSNLKKYPYINSLKQERPVYLRQQKEESLSTWRDRIFQLYRIPYIQSALADLKYPYTEQINPFLSRKIVTTIREIPDHLRTDKKLFKQIMKSLDLNIPFSKKDSNASMTNVLKQEQIVHLIRKELTSDYARKLFPTDFLSKIIQNLKVEESTEQKVQTKNIVQRIKQIIPKKFKIYIVQQKPSLILDENVLAFRIFIICKMHRQLSFQTGN